MGEGKIMSENKETEQPQEKAHSCRSAVERLVMPVDASVNHMIKAIVLGGFISEIEECTDGRGIVELEALEGYLAGVLTAACEIQTKINSYIPVNTNTGKPLIDEIERNNVLSAEQIVVNNLKSLGL